MVSTRRKDDPFERSRMRTMEDMFDKNPEYQWQLDLYDKLWGKSLGNAVSGIERHQRIAVRRWPRAPGGAVITQLPPGHTTPSSTHLWGQRLLDFFCFSRGTDEMAPHDQVISTSSRVSAWMKCNGETEYAKDEMMWAETEEPPCLRPAADIMEVLNARELLIMMGSCGVSLHNETEATAENDDVDVKSVEFTSSVSLFDYKKYPDPWPLVPFSSNSPTLQSPIPFHLLPETLIVHDPFHLLRGNSVRDDGDDWTSVNDITHRYKLNLTVDSINETIATERRKIQEKTTSSTPVVVATLFNRRNEGHLDDCSATVVPADAYKVTVPPPPLPPVSIPEAHLYLSPAHSIGIGNHSLVYRAEWDLPRSVFSKPKICATCVAEAARKIIRETAESVDISDSSDSPASSSSSNTSSNGILEIHEERLPKLTLKFSKFRFDSAELAKSGEIDEEHTLEDEKAFPRVDYSGPVSTVHVDTVPWYDPASTAPAPCAHLTENSICGSLPGSPPPTTQVSVVAKLSLAGDNHLKQEAVNYQRFGMQFSQHWTGYTLATPLQDPTPMGAITPIFYGFYTKEDTSSSKYFSPILLLEDCGKPIEPSELDFDDKQECAALVLRLHYHGWTQGSFWPRNIVMQLGDHADFPLMKSDNDRRFRLIDFGRAKCLKDAREADRVRGDNKDTQEDQWDKDRFNEKCVIGDVLEFGYPT